MRKNLPFAIVLTALVACLSLIASFCYAMILAYVSALFVSLLVANGMPLGVPLALAALFVLADTVYHFWYNTCLLNRWGPHTTMALYATFGAVFYLHAREMAGTYPWFLDVAIIALTMFCATFVGTTGILKKFSRALERALAAP